MPPDRWRLVVVAFLVWLIAFSVVEGLGRQVCRMPTARWIAAAGDGRDRTMRETFRDRATLCLDDTTWYVWSMRVLVILALAIPLAALGLVRRRRELVRGLTLAGALAVTIGSIAAVRWLYDWMS